MRVLEGRTALVTGATGEIGREICEHLAGLGCNLVLHSRGTGSTSEDLSESLKRDHSVEVSQTIFDLLDGNNVAAEMKDLLRRLPRLDVLVNNAAVAHGGLFQMTPLPEIRRVFEINFFSHIEVTQRVVRHMTRNRSGSIINLASIAGLDLHAGNIAYGTSKAAMIALTRTLAAEVGRYGVRVNAVAPGLVDSPMAEQMEPRARAAMVAASAMARLASPSEIASVVAFLASDGSKFINGEVIRVDGGST